MKRLSTILTLASGVFGVIPGITVLISNVGVPPNTSKMIFSGTIEALGVLTLLLLWVNKEWISGMRIRAINRLALLGALTFLFSLFCYIFLFNYLVIEVEHTAPLFFPLWPQGELSRGIEKFGTREALITEWGRDDVYKVIQSSSRTTWLMTTMLLLFIYQLMFVGLTFAFGVLGIRCSEPKDHISI